MQRDQNGKFGLSAMKGMAVNFPHPLKSTLNEVTDTLPNQDLLKIIVDSLPTCRREVWRNLVDMEKVISALRWLKANNPYYKDIEILDNELDETRIFHFVQDTTQGGI